MRTTRSTARWKRRLQNLALFCVVFALCVVSFEVALRLLGYGNLEIYEPDARLFWRLKPNQDCYTKVDHKPVHINSHGTRGPEFTAQKPPGLLRILCLGDSRTFGWGLSEAETYPAELARLLGESNAVGTLFSAKNPDAVEGPDFGANQSDRRSTNATRRFEVINAGVNGWSYQQMLVFYRDIAAAWQPDVVVVGEANLWTQFSEESDPEFVRRFLMRVRLKNLLRRFAIYHYVVEVKLRDFYEAYRLKFIPVNPREDTLFKAQQKADPEAAFRSAIAGICIRARTNGAKPVLLFLPTQNDLESGADIDVGQLKRELAGQLTIPLVNLMPELAQGGKSLYLDHDPVHLNRPGNMLVARRLFESISRQLTP
jgi:lysophospholipase L1-like esterase